MYLHLRALLQALRDHQDQIVLNYFCLAALSWQYWVKFHQVLMSAVFISIGSSTGCPDRIRFYPDRRPLSPVPQLL